MEKEYARKGFLWFITNGKTNNFNDVAMCPAACKLLVGVLVAALLVCLSYQPAFAAISGSDVQTQVGSAGKEAVVGDVLIWSLCAISFLKISQKINSFMASLDINVGRTGGSMLAEAMITTKGLFTVRSTSSRHFRGGHSSSTHTNSVRNPKSKAADATGGFMSGGLAGIISRSIQNGAVRAATGSPETGTPGGTGSVGGDSSGIDGQVFASSISKDGDFANSVISSIATGSIAASGSMTGEKAAQALQSYMGYAALGESAERIPSFSDVEIDGGRIAGTEVSEEYPKGAAFGIYHTAQYTAPSGSYTTIQTADGASWYRRYATDAVEKSPYMASSGFIAYNESIVKKLPPSPQRKDRIQNG